MGVGMLGTTKGGLSQQRSLLNKVSILSTPDVEQPATDATEYLFSHPFSGIDCAESYY